MISLSDETINLVYALYTEHVNELNGFFCEKS